MRRVGGVRRWSTLASAVALISVLLAVESTPAAVAQTEVQLSGVVSYASGLPAETVNVEVVEPGSDAVVASTTTSAAGAYAVALEPGVYDVRFTAPAGIELAETVEAVDVASDVVLDHGFDPLVHTLSGRLGTASGVPMAGAILQVGENTLTTAADGSFIVNLDPATYTLSISPMGGGGYSTLFTRDRVIDLTAGSLDLMLELPDLVRLEVGVVDPDGVAVPGADIIVGGQFRTFEVAPGIELAGFPSAFASTGSDGTAMFEILPIQQAELTVDRVASRFIGNITTDSAVEVELPDRATFSGNVSRPDGAPAPLVGVQLGDPFSGPATFTDAQGAFTVSHIEAIHPLRLSNTGASTYTALESDGPVVDLAAGDVEQDLVLPEVFDLQFELVDTTGAPVPDLELDLRGAARRFEVAPGLELAGQPFAFGATDADGIVEWRSHPIVGGIVNVGGLFDHEFGAVDQSTVITIEVPPVNMLSGTVRAADGSPVAGVTVGLGDRLAQSDDDGRYELRQIAGLHELALHGVGGGYHSLRPTAASIDLRAGDVELDLTLPELVEVRVSVVDPDATPVAGSFLSLFGGDRSFEVAPGISVTGTVGTSATSDAAGLAVFEVFPVVDASISNVEAFEPLGDIETSLDVDFTVPARRILSGTLHYQDGTPIDGAFVHADLHGASVASDGTFSFEVGAGLRSIAVLSSGSGLGSVALAEDILIDLRTEDQVVDLVLPTPVPLRVEAVDASGQPMAFATVSATRAATTVEVAPSVTATLRPRYTALAGADGIAVLAVMPGDDYEVSINALHTESIGAVDAATDVVVQQPVLRSVSGTVRDEAGQAVQAFLSIGGQFAFADSGRFTLIHTAATHDLSLSAFGYGIPGLETRSGSVDLTDADVELDLVLPETVDLQVRVLDTEGSPAPGVDVFLAGDDRTFEVAPGLVLGGAPSAGTITDGDGFATITTLPVSNARVSVPGANTVNLGDLDADTSLEVSLLTQRRFSGTVVFDDGSPAGAVGLRVGPSAAVTDAAGSFEVLVPEGSYPLTVSNLENGYPFLGFGLATVDLRDTDVALDLVLPEVIDLAVHVVDATGQPVADAAIEVVGTSRTFDLGGGITLGGFPQLGAPTDEAGVAAFQTFALSEARVLVDGVERMHLGNVEAPADVVVELPPTAELRGVIRNADGSAAAGLEVQLGAASTITDATGTYSLRADQGRHQLVIRASEQATFFTGETAVDLTGGDRTLDIDLPETFEREIVVELEPGTPAPDVELSVLGIVAPFAGAPGITFSGFVGGFEQTNTAGAAVFEVAALESFAVTLAGIQEVELGAVDGAGTDVVALLARRVVSGRILDADGAGIPAFVQIGPRQSFTSDGAFEIEVTEGLHDLTLAVPGHFPELLESRAGEIDTIDGDVTIDLVLPSVLDVDILVVDHLGRGVGDATVTMTGDDVEYEVAPFFVVGGRPNLIANTDASGLASVQTLPVPNAVFEVDGVQFVIGDLTSSTVVELMLPEPPGTSIEIAAAGSTGEEVLELHLDGEPIAVWTVAEGAATRDFELLTYRHPDPVDVGRLSVAFTNNGTTAAGADRNLRVDAIVVGGVRFESEHPETFSTGTWNASTGCAPGAKQSEWLHCDGEFTYAEPPPPATTTTTTVLPTTTSAPTTTTTVVPTTTALPTTTLPTGSTSIVVRALGATGQESFDVRVDGTVVASFVAGPSFAEYVVEVDTGVAGSTVEVAFTNNGTTAAGADRNLRVDAIVVGGVRFESEHPETFSTGTWNASTGCAPGAKQSEWLHCNGEFAYEVGSVATTTTAAPTTTVAPTTTASTTTSSGAVTTTTTVAGPSTTTMGTDTEIVVRAAGSTGEEELALIVRGVEVARWTVGSGAAERSFGEFVAVVESPVSPGDIEVAFTNDGPASDGSDRNLRVDAIVVGSTLVESEDPETTSTGSWNSSTGCARGNKQSEWLHCAGSFFYSGPTTPPPPSTTVVPPSSTEPPMTTTTLDTGSGTSIVVRAAGSTGEEVVSLEIDGIVVESWTLPEGAATRDFVNLSYQHPLPVGVDDVTLRFVNNGVSSTGADRNARIDFLSIDGLVFQTEAPETFSTGSWAPGSGCAPGNKEIEWLHCNGALQF